MFDSAHIPLFNACMNGLSTLFLLIGFIAIKKEKVAFHKTMMFSALGTSAIFLTSYLYYHYNVGHSRIIATGTLKTVYYLILFPHLILATLMVPMILITFFFALRGQFNAHKKIAKFTLPTWLYVSFTGVVLYLFIYQLYPQEFERSGKLIPTQTEEIAP